MFPWFPWLFFYAPIYNIGSGWKWQNDSSNEKLWDAFIKVEAKTNQNTDTLSWTINRMRNLSPTWNESDRAEIDLHLSKLAAIREL